MEQKEVSNMRDCLVKLEYQGIPCWHIVTVSRLKKPLLQKFKAGQVIDVSEIGEIQMSGWGSNVPNSVNKKFNLK